MGADTGCEANRTLSGLLHAIVTPRSYRHRSPLTTNLDRILGDLLADVLNGYRTVAEASDAYGVQPPGGGRQRRFASFGDYLTDRIGYATDPAVEDQLHGLLARVASSRRLRGSDTRRINVLLAETGQERAERLRALQAELGTR